MHECHETDALLCAFLGIYPIVLAISKQKQGRVWLASDLRETDRFNSSKDLHQMCMKIKGEQFGIVFVVMMLHSLYGLLRGTRLPIIKFSWSRPHVYRGIALGCESRRTLSGLFCITILRHLGYSFINILPEAMIRLLFNVDSCFI